MFEAGRCSVHTSDTPEVDGERDWLSGASWPEEIISKLYYVDCPEWSDDFASDDEKDFQVETFKHFLRNKKDFLSWLSRKLQLKDRDDESRRATEMMLIEKEATLMKTRKQVEAELQDVRVCLGKIYDKPFLRLENMLRRTSARSPRLEVETETKPKSVLKRRRAELLQLRVHQAGKLMRNLRIYHECLVGLGSPMPVDEESPPEPAKVEQELSLDFMTFKKYELRFHQFVRATGRYSQQA